MFSYISRRIFLLIFVLLGVTVMTFTLMHLTPGDPAEMIAIARYGLDSLNSENIEAIRVSEGLDSSVLVQYLHWLNHSIHLDLGCSIISGDPVVEEILLRTPATLKLALLAMLVSLLIGIPAGIIAASKRASVVDYLVMTGALLGASMPNFWLGLLLILLFSVTLGCLPVCGYGELRNIILPAITLGTGLTAITTRLTRSSMLEVLQQDYINTARSKGLRELRIMYRHAMKNAFIPVVTIIGLQFGHLLEGTVVVESIFAWPGIGKLLVDSIFARDFTMIQGCVLFFAFVFVIVNLLVDIIYVFLDPKIRYEKEC